MDARGEFAGIEGFWKVVVRADFKAEDAVDVFTARRQHDNRDAGGSSNFLEDVEAAKAGKHNVENQQGVVFGERSLNRLGAGVHCVDLKSLGLKIFGEQFAKFDVVVDDEKAAKERINGRRRSFQCRIPRACIPAGFRDPGFLYCK